MKNEQIGAAADSHWQYAEAAPSLYRSYEAAPRLHFAVICLPLWGHFQAAHAVAEELAHREHHITYFVENPKWCDVVLEPGRRSKRPWNVKCVVVNTTTEGLRTLFTPAVFAKISAHSSYLRGFSDLFEEVLSHHADTLPHYLDAAAAVHNTKPLTTFLCDLTTFVCGSVARFFDASVVHVFPFTLQMALGFHTELPAMGSALPRAMSTWQRTKNYVAKLTTFTLNGFAVAGLNRVRKDFGIAPYRDAFDVAGLYDTVLVLGLWGLDIAQPLCPNVHPVGPLLTRADRAASPSDLTDEGLLDFLDRCEQGVIYVNFGTLAFLSDGTVLKLYQGLRDVPFCVVWKLPRNGKTDPIIPVEQNSTQFFVRPWFSVPIGILRHPNVFAFLSHCGDASVMESIGAGVPVLGLPIFADQGDVCQRLHEAGAGVCLSGKYSFTPQEVTEGVWRLVRHSSDYAANLRRLQTVSKTLGGPSRAADVIEMRQYNLFLRRESSMEQCAMLADGVFHATGMGRRLPLLLLVVLLWWLLFLLAGRVWRRHVASSQSLRAWFAKLLWWRRLRTGKPRGGRARIVLRRFLHEEPKDE